MGSLSSRRGDRPDATAEFYPDKVVKFAVIPTIFVMAIIAVIVLYGVDRVKCSSRDRRNYGYDLTEVNDYCWNNPRPAFQVNRINYTIYNHTLFSSPPPNATVVTYKVWVQNPPLHRHKIFPILLICECASLAIPLLIWHWCIAHEIKTHTKAILNHANSLTEAYKTFDRSKSRADEAEVYRQLDNYLEYLSYLLGCKVRRLYFLHLIKWIVMLVITVAWFGGNLGLFSPDFVIFRNSFTCLYDSVNEIAYDCYFPTAVYLRVVWYINIVILGILIILILIHIVVDLCWPRKYQDTYLHRGVPGARDGRLADCIQKNHNSRYYGLLSKLCDENEHLCTDPGLSKSLARRYGHQLGKRSGYGGTTDGEKGNAFIKPEQIERFANSTDNPDKSSPLCGGCCFCCAGPGSTDDIEPSLHNDRPRGYGPTDICSPGNDLANGFPPGHGHMNGRPPGHDLKTDDQRESRQTGTGYRHFPPEDSPVDNARKKEESGPDSDPRDLGYYMPPKQEQQQQFSNENFGPEKKSQDSVDPHLYDFTPDHLYLQELLRYRYPEGLNPKFPVDGRNSVRPTNNETRPHRSEPPKSSPRRVIFHLPKRLKRTARKKPRSQRRPASPPNHSGVIVLEDLEDYPPPKEDDRSTKDSYKAEPESKMHGGDTGRHYHNPYGGTLSSRVLMPYYDPKSGEYKDLNPLAFKIRQKVRKTLSRNVKVWKP